jgi:hypothetical protein
VVALLAVGVFVGLPAVFATAPASAEAARAAGAQAVAGAPALAEAAQGAGPHAVAAATHVALIAGHGSTSISVCVDWHPGMSGTQVLQESGWNLGWGQRPPYQGMLLQINGDPANPDPQVAYWAYFENGAYSNAGPTGSTPAAGSVEGWSYVSADGSTPTGPGGSYRDICAGRDPVTPPPATSRAPVQPAPPVRSTPATQPTSARPPVHRSTAASSAAVPSVSAATSASSVPVPTGTAAARPPTAKVSPVAHSRSTGGGPPPWGTLVVVAAVLALGGGGFWFSRRRAHP